MQSNILTNSPRRTSSSHSVRKSVNFKALLVVYRVEKGHWKGFIHPYGETTEASTKEKAIKKLRDLADAYHEAIERYDSPRHLVSGHLDDVMDRDVFRQVVGDKSFMEKIHSESGKADSQSCYVETYRGKP